MPKWSLAAIPKVDDGGGIEDLHILVGARVSGSRPNVIVVFSLKPRPKKTKNRGKLVEVKHPETPIHFGGGKRFPN
jgi:hypothetical protein